MPRASDPVWTDIRRSPRRQAGHQDNGLYTKQFGDSKRVVNDFALTFTIHGMKLIAIAVQREQDKPVPFKHRKELSSLLCAFQQATAGCMRSGIPVAGADLQARKAEFR